MGTSVSVADTPDYKAAFQVAASSDFVQAEVGQPVQHKVVVVVSVPANNLHFVLAAGAAADYAGWAWV